MNSHQFSNNVSKYYQLYRHISNSSSRKIVNYELRLRLAAAYRGLCAYDLHEGVLNHLTAIAPAAETEGDVMLIIPHGLHWSEVTPSCFIGMDKDCNIVEGKGQQMPVAAYVHRGIYNKRPDVKGIMHTHMPYATALSCLKDPRLLMISQISCCFYNKIAYDTSYSGLGESLKEGERMAQVLGQKSVLVLGNHGIVTVGDCIDDAFDEMYYFERAAKLQVLALSTNKEVKELDEEIILSTQKQLNEQEPIFKYSKSHLDFFVRNLRKSCPEIVEKTEGRNGFHYETI